MDTVNITLNPFKNCFNIPLSNAKIGNTKNHGITRIGISKLVKFSVMKINEQIE